MYLGTIIRFLGVCLIILAITNPLGLTNLSMIYLAGFSITALMFVIVDFLEYKANEKDDPFKFRKTKNILNFLAVFSFVIFPVIDINLSKKFLLIINDVAVLISLGLVFIIISFKHDKMVSDKLDKIIYRYIDNFKKSPEFEKMVKDQAVITIRELDVEAQTREAIKKIENEKGSKV